MNRKLGMNADCLRGISTVDALPLIKAAGFESFFVGTHRDEQYEAIPAIKAEADRLGLTFEFIHGPFAGIIDMWLPGMDYLTVFEGLKRSIDVAAANGVPAVITHVSTKWNAPMVNDLGLARYDELVLYAKEKGVILAFENLRMLGNLACLVDRYAKMDNVKFCYDCGHEHCFTKSVRWMDIFRFNTYCTHIHDNHGREWDDLESPVDEHLLPFDGNYDYEQMMRKLDEYNYTGSLMLEISHKKEAYAHLTVEEFLATAYERIKKISEM